MDVDIRPDVTGEKMTKILWHVKYITDMSVEIAELVRIYVENI